MLLSEHFQAPIGELVLTERKYSIRFLGIVKNRFNIILSIKYSEKKLFLFKQGKALFENRRDFVVIIIFDFSLKAGAPKHLLRDGWIVLTLLDTHPIRN